MIYQIIIVDSDSGILILEKQLKALDKPKTLNNEILAGFFKALNSVIDEIQKSMKKGRDVENMSRIVSSENSLIILHFHPQSRVLMCSISDPDDEQEKLIEVLRVLAKRFWSKHQSDIEIFRKKNTRDVFTAFSVDIETYTLGGKVAEKFPSLLIAESALDRIIKMGVVTDFEYEISKLCDGSRSAMKIAIKLGGVSVESVKRSLNKLEDLDIIKMN
jgi:hypothetical protein